MDRARRYIRAWYLAYLLLGTVTGGLLPVILPLAVAAITYRLSWVAYVMAAYNVGLLTSPAWGILAERTRAYRQLFLGSFLVTGAGIVGMLLLRKLSLWLPSAFALGAGSGGGATLATLFVVDFAVQAEWEVRLGWLQSFNASGQVLGLMLAAAFSGANNAVGMWVCVAVLLVAIIIAGISLPLSNSSRVPGATSQYPRLQSRTQVLAYLPRPHLPSGALHCVLSSLDRFRDLPQAVGKRFGRFLLSWAIWAFAVAAFFSYFPLILRDNYNIAAHATAMIYAVTSAICIGLYVLTSHLTVRYGPSRVYHSGLALRILGFGLLLVPFVVSNGSRSLFGAAGFALVVIAWPLLSVSGSDLAARLTHFTEGAAVGLQNAVLGLATVAGIVCTGPLVARWGYGIIPATAFIGLAGALLLDMTASDSAMKCCNTSLTKSAR